MASGRHRRRTSVTRGLLRRAVWAMAQLRAGRPLKAADLSRRFEVSLRTAYRDFDFLRDEWRAPIEFDPARQSYVTTDRTALIAPITLSAGELLAVFFAEKVLRQYRGTPFESDLASAFRKIQDLLPDDVSIDPSVLDDVLSLDLGPAQCPDPAVFAGLLAALRRRHAVLVRYRSLNSGRTADRRIRPYHVFNHRGDWYVAAFDERRAAVRDFALHRMRRLVETTESFEIPRDFDFRRYAAGAFGIEKGTRPVDVVIRFGPRQARWIRERSWHRTARVEGLIDGGCLLRLSVSGLGEVRRWLMQFGSEAEVLAPRALRTQVAHELELASAAYHRRSKSGGRTALPERGERTGRR